MPLRPLAALLSGALGAACVTTHEANLHEYFESRGLEVTQDDAPENARPLEVISYYKSGFYLFGYAPIVDVELEDAVDYVTERAVHLEADGISHLSFQYEPASLFKFTIFPLPDWSSWIHVSGMAYRLEDPPAEVFEPIPEPEPEPVEVPRRRRRRLPKASLPVGPQPVESSPPDPGGS